VLQNRNGAEITKRARSHIDDPGYRKIDGMQVLESAASKLVEGRQEISQIGVCE
jgi:hypothetical protein